MDTNTPKDTPKDTPTQVGTNLDTGAPIASSIHRPTLPEGASFLPYDTQIELAAKEGLRAVKCLYKMNMKTQKAAAENSYIYIPDTITPKKIEENLTKLMPYLVSYLKEQEDALVKDLHKLKVSTVFASNLGINKIIERLERSSLGNRLNKEMIEAWFTENVAESLAEAFATKLGVTEKSSEAELSKLSSVLEVYKIRFSSLAGGKVSMKETECDSLQRAISISDSLKTPIGARFYARLESMKKAQEVDLLAL